MVRRLSDAYLYVMLTVFPLWFTERGYTSIADDKFLFFAFVTVLFSAAIIIYTVFSKINGHALIPFSLTAACWCVLAFIAACTVSAALSAHPDTVLFGGKRQEGLFTMLLYAAAFFIAASSGGLHRGHLIAFGSVMVLMSVLITAQFCGKNPFTLYPDGMCFHDRYIKYGSEFLGTLGNSALLSALLSLCVPLFSALFLYGSGRMRYMYLLFSAVTLWSLLLSEVLAGRVGVLAALFSLIPFSLKDGKGAKLPVLFATLLVVTAVYNCLSYDYNVILDMHFNVNGLSVSLFLSALLLFAVAYFVRHAVSGKKAAFTALLLQTTAVVVCLLIIYMYPWKSGFFYELSAVMHGQFDDSFGSSRIQIWKEGLELFRQRVFFGGGPDTYGVRSEILFTRDTGNGIVSSSVSAAHNEYLNILVNTGVFSLVFYLGILAFSFYFAIKGKITVSICIAAGILGYAVQALFGISQPVSAPFMWIMLGLLQAKNCHSDFDNSMSVC